MIGILIIAHGNVGEELIKAATSIVKEVKNITSIVLPTEEDREVLKKKLLEKIDSLNASDGVLILVDVPGSSSYNLAKEILNERKVRIVTGVNLPMVLTSITKETQMSLDEIAKKVIDSGKKSIMEYLPEDIK